MSERFTRKSLKHDEFVEAAFDFERWIVARWKAVAAGVGAVIVLGLVIWGVAAMSRGKVERASRDLSAGIAQLLPAPGAESLPSSDVAAKYTAALPSFEKAAADAAGSAPGRTATYYRGAALVRLGRAAEAVPILEGLVASGEEDLLIGIAQAKLAEALALTQQTDRAVAAWKELGGRVGAYYPRDLARYWEADTLYRAGRTAEAKTILDELVAAAPGIATEDAKRLLARVGGTSATPAP